MKHIALIASFATLALMTVASAAPTPVATQPAAATPAADPEVEVALLTGRWRLFFGAKICWGQVVNLPGESQCV